MLFIVYLKKNKHSYKVQRSDLASAIAIEIVVGYHIPCKAPCEMKMNQKRPKNEILLKEQWKPVKYRK